MCVCFLCARFETHLFAFHVAWKQLRHACSNGSYTKMAVLTNACQKCDEILDPSVLGVPSFDQPTAPWQWPTLAQAWGSQAPVIQNIPSQMNPQTIPAMCIYIWMTLVPCEFMSFEDV